MGIVNVLEIPLYEVRAAAVNAVKQLGIDVEIPQNLSELGMKSEDIQRIVIDACRDVYTLGNRREATVEKL